MAKNKKNCSGTKGYNCGNSCISVKYACKKDGLSGQSVSIASKHQSLIATAKDKTKKPTNKYPTGQPINTEGMKVLGDGAFGLVYSDGNGKAIKVEDNQLLESIMDGEGGWYDSEKYAVQKKKAMELNNRLAERGFANKIDDTFLASDGKMYTVMDELVGYTNLDDTPPGKKPVEWNTLMKARVAMIEEGILHNDLHEGNIMYNADTGDVKIIDLDLGNDNGGKLTTQQANRDWATVISDLDVPTRPSWLPKPRWRDD